MKNIDNYALRLLKVRPRSVAEMWVRLKQKGFQKNEIAQAINKLKESGCLDDRQFAKYWAQNRKLKGGVGASFIKYELIKKGIKEPIVSETLSEFKEDYDEYEQAKDVIKKCLKSSKALDEYSKRRRLYGYLTRRGFSDEIIDKSINLNDL